MYGKAEEFTIPDYIETPRMHLRMFQQEDWRDLHRYYSDAECTKYTIQSVLSEADSWRMMAGMLGHWYLRGYGPYALEEKSSGQVVGIAGMWYPQDWPEPEIKWGLSRAYWGQGLASEAARAVKQMVEKTLPGMSLISLIYAANERSKNVALALGAKFEREIEFRGNLAHIYRHTPSNSN